MNLWLKSILRVQLELLVNITYEIELEHQLKHIKVMKNGLCL